MTVEPSRSHQPSELGDDSPELPEGITGPASGFSIGAPLSTRQVPSHGDRGSPESGMVSILVEEDTYQWLLRVRLANKLDTVSDTVRMLLEYLELGR